MRINRRSRLSTALLSAIVALSGLVAAAPAGSAQSDDPPTVTISPDTVRGRFDVSADLAGTAADDNGVSRVAVSIRNSDGDWLRADGSFGAFSRQNATLSAPGAAGTAWSFGVDLPEGAYGLTVAAFDNTGQRSTSSPWTTFSVRVSDFQPPTATIDEPAAGRLLDSGSLTFTGTATDASGVEKVLIWVYDTDDCAADGIDPDNCSLHMVLAPLANPGATQTTWSVDFVVPDGQWRIEVRRVRDVLGNSVYDPGVGIGFATGAPADAAPPTIELYSPQDGEIYRVGARLKVAAYVTDDVLPAGGFLAVRNLDTGQFLQADGSFVSGFTLVGYDVDRFGVISTRLVLEPGNYQVWGRAFDYALKLSDTVTAQFKVVARPG